MNPRLNELLAKFALDQNYTAISSKFTLQHDVSAEERRALYELIATILRGYIFADLQTQEIIEILGEGNNAHDGSNMLSHAIIELNRRDNENPAPQPTDQMCETAEAESR